jgi:amino acid transporter
MLPRALGLCDMVLFNIVAVASLRWFVTVAAAGPSSITLWILAGLFFFVPRGLAVSDLSALPRRAASRLDQTHTFGEDTASCAEWCYWVKQHPLLSRLLHVHRGGGTYVIGRGERARGSWYYVLPATLAALWLAVALNIVGVRTGRWLQNAGGLGTYVPGVVLVGLGLYAALTHPSATPMSGAALLPDLADPKKLNLWASIAFAFAGLELCAVMGGEVKDPTRTLPRSILISGPLIAFIYIAGTVSVLWLVPSAKSASCRGSSGVARRGGTSGPVPSGFPRHGGLPRPGNIGGVGAWLTGPARVAFVMAWTLLPAAWADPPTLANAVSQY